MTFTSDQEVTDQLRQLYDIGGRNFARWFPIFWKEVMPSHKEPKMNALQLAAFNGHEQQISLLLAAGKGDIDAPDDTGTYMIIWASLNGHDKIVRMLLERGTDINAQGGDFRNALQAACWNGHDKIARMLLEPGADINAQGGAYGKVFQAARQRKHHHILQILQQYHCPDQSTFDLPPSKKLKISSEFHITESNLNPYDSSTS